MKNEDNKTTKLQERRKQYRVWLPNVFFCFFFSINASPFAFRRRTPNWISRRHFKIDYWQTTDTTVCFAIRIMMGIESEMSSCPETINRTSRLSSYRLRLYARNKNVFLYRIVYPVSVLDVIFPSSTILTRTHEPIIHEYEFLLRHENRCQLRQ